MSFRARSVLAAVVTVAVVARNQPVQDEIAPMRLTRTRIVVPEWGHGC